MQTITTKYIGPRGTRGSRIIARASGGHGSVHLDIDNRFNLDYNQRQAVRELCRRRGWTGKLVPGSLDANTTVWVFYHGEEVLTIE
jgi:hypothetical protein